MDKKQLQTFKWLDSLSSRLPKGLKACHNPYHDHIMVRYGRFYATNGYVIACAEWDDKRYLHLAALNWETVSRFMDDVGRPLDMPETVKHWFAHEPLSDALESYFPEPKSAKQPNPIVCTPSVFTQALRGFDINGLCPSVCFTDTMALFTGHNREISLRVACMLCRNDG